MAYREKDTKKWTAQWFETNVMGEKKKRRKRGFETKREALEFERSKKLSNERSMDMKLSDFIEIYDKNSIQVFRSFELFHHLSYSLSEIFTYTWVDLFNRDDFVFKRMFELSEGVLSGKIVDILHPRFPDHIVEEKFSSKQFWVKMRHKIICPLRAADGSIGGLLNTFKIIDSGCKQIV